MFLPAYSQLNKINQCINPCHLKGGRYTSSSLGLYYSNDSFLYLIESPLQGIFLKLALFFFFFLSLTVNFKTTFIRKTPKVTFFRGCCTTTFIQFAFVVLHSRGGSWELVDAFSLCCLTWHFWKILAAWSGEWGVVGSFCLLFLLELGV